MFSFQIDICDPSKRFGREVPKRARQLPLLAYSILAFSSRHQVMITGIDDEKSEEYHSHALRILIPILDDPMSSLDENLLAAAVLLRLYEEMCDVDTGTHLIGCARLWNNIPDFIAEGGLSEAASWILLRQNLHISLIKGEPMQVDLNKYRRSRSFIETTDEDFANRIILICCQVLETFFGPGAQPDYEAWVHLGKEVALWHDSIPAHYHPYHSDMEGGSAGVKSAFPVVWMMNPARGYQHYCLARILLHISEPRLWVSSLRTIEHRVAADQAALNDLHIAVGLGIHNPSVLRRRRAQDFTKFAHKDSSPNSFLNSEDDSVRVADNPDFLDLGNGNTETLKRHNKRTGPPYLLEYTKWKITLERQKGDDRDFKRPGWLIGFREPSVHWGVPEGHGRPWEFVIAPGEHGPETVRNVWDGDMFYTTNSYFDLFINGKKPQPTRRTYTEYTDCSAWERQGYKFEIIRTENDKLARENRAAWGPLLSDNEVLVKFHAASLNFRDIMIAQVLGLAVGGTVDGTLREYGVFNENGLVEMPRNLNYLEAATLPCSALTAWNALYGLKAVLPGDWILTQGTGGVSISALQFAKAAGARVVATTSSAAKAQRLRDLGADHVINYKAIPNWGEEAKRLIEGGVDHILEVGGAHTIAQSLSAVKINGIITTIIGWIGGPGETGPSFGQTLSSMATIRGIVARAIEASDIKPILDEQLFKLEGLKDVYKYLVDQKYFNKVAIEMG
nr:hypothetical protein FVER53263_01520 [Fusarium verticillioides]